MKDRHIDRLEARLENLIEGAFAQFFGRKIRAQDLALQLARAMESALEPPQPGDPRPVAPDHYRIFLNPSAAQHLFQRKPHLPDTLGDHMIELAAGAGYRLVKTPQVDITPEPSLSTGKISVTAQHTGQTSPTSAMQPIRISQPGPENPQLVLNGLEIVPLEEPLITIGRSPDNHIVVDDPQVSRHHAQLRLRFGTYMLFDTQSRGGTFVNEVRIREHTLHSGDVIHIGRTRMVYLADSDDTNTTGTMPPVNIPPPEEPT